MHYELSGWWRRAGAAMIDALLITIPTTIALWLAGFDFGTYYGEDGGLLYASRAVDLTYLLVDAVFALAYFTPQMVAWEGRTLGKRALGIRVVRADGGRLDVKTVVGRQVVVQYLLLGLIPPAALLNYLAPLVDRQNRAGHDFVAKTRVVRDDAGARRDVHQGDEPPGAWLPPRAGDGHGT